MVNKAILIGTWGKILMFVQQQEDSLLPLSRCNFQRFTDRNGQRQDRTEWHTVAAWGKLAELVWTVSEKGAEYIWKENHNQVLG